ncbi:subunit 21 of Mediator complex [Aspergillus terreus]|uniref:Subunit 21 of Mediator complex n=1 Tax=Aspergillus terreus TaxID=33178 RepID=A0A5M3YS55_ASPTE|nr:hypothetical protein ATETN484_0002021000 [Aspergillus terreus]GFF15066.1 subunit 21 of Mediator complex [Aspergillus terreus]
METAPLTLAHSHARNAVLETRKSNPVAASEEHDLAAGEFAAAAQSSSDREALRTLQLLEQHHKQLAQILRFQHEHPHSAPSVGSTDPGTAKALSQPTDTQQQPPKLTAHPRLPTRESSSIASNLASARGIPAQPRRASPASPTVSAQQAGAKMVDGPTKIRTSERLRGTQAHGTKERSSRPSAPRQPWSPPSISPTEITSQEYVPPPVESLRPRDKQSLTDEGFQKFYSTVEGLISKISAPLAFAGLPLGLDGASQAESNRKSPADTRVDRHHATSDRHVSSADPDISKIFSKAALQAIRDSTGGGTGNTAESFYVVPTTGGTVSYAGILARKDKDARRNSLDVDDDDDFVDARETPASPEVYQSLSRGKGKFGRGSEKLTSLQNPKTMEELQMENQALRHLSDTLSKRLHMWEVNAQSSSMALQQSLKAMHHQNIPSPEQHPQSSSAVPSPVSALSAPPVSEHDQRVKELEELIKRSEKELEKVGRENEKLRNVVGRYRERWEKLKEGAKTRRAEAMSSADRQNRADTSLAPASIGSPRPQAGPSAGQEAEVETQDSPSPENEAEQRTDPSDT